MRRKLIAGNWKMYKNQAETKSFLEQVDNVVATTVDAAIFCQAPLLSIFQAQAKKLKFGPQSIYWEEKGAFTGELSPRLASELGCTFALAGHSERRQFFGETNESAVKRALAAHRFGMKAVFCLGESLVERESSHTFQVLQQQLEPLFRLSPKYPEDFCFAYEPVWAIGTGKNATAQQAQEVHNFLRQEICKAWGSEVAARCRMLYGGSVKAENARELMSQADIDGVLVGGASLEAGSFLAIAAAAN